MTTTRRPSSTKLRREVFDTFKYTDELTGKILMDCHLCGHPIDPVRQEWAADHVIRRVLSGDDTIENLRPIHEKCHRGIKTPQDIRENAKGKRVRDKHFKIEVKRKKQWKPEGTRFDWSTGRYVKIGADE